jgi:hypothetical protein
MARRRTDPAVKYNWFKHLVAPIVGIIIVFLPIYGSVWPWPTWPLNLITILIFVFLLVGIGVALMLRNRPDKLGDQIAFLLATGGGSEPLEGEQSATSPTATA